MNTKATTKAEAIAYLSLACMRLQCREDFPRGRTGYIEHICSPHATKAGREDAYKMAVRGLDDTEEARTIRADIDAYYAVDDAKEAAAALGRMGGSSTSPAKRAASRANGAQGGRPAWRILDRWDVDEDGAEDMLVRDERTGRRVLLARRHNLGAADPATWCVAYDCAGVDDVRAAVDGAEHIQLLASVLDPLDWAATVCDRVARVAERA